MENTITRSYHPELKEFRLVLLAFAILYSFRIPSEIGMSLHIVLGFAPPAFFIISGYLVLRESEHRLERIRRTIGRTAVCFIVLAIVYFLFSLIMEPYVTLSRICTKRFWFYFLVLNIWSLPIGSVIWYVQALLYAYIIIYFLERFKLLRFDWVLVTLCLIFAFISEDLSGMVGFNFLGHSYISGNWLTRALPYVLAGCLICRNYDALSLLRVREYVLIGIFGLTLVFGEYCLLTRWSQLKYTDHFIGAAFMAFSLCLFVFFYEFPPLLPNLKLTRYEIMIPYYICSPIYYFLVMWMGEDGENRAPSFTIITLLTVAFSFMVLILYAFIRWLIPRLSRRRRKDLDNGAFL